MYLYYIPLDKLKFIFCVKKYWAGCYSILNACVLQHKQIVLKMILQLVDTVVRTFSKGSQKRNLPFYLVDLVGI